MSDPVATLRCPNCGAPAAPDAARCEYCRTVLAAVSCPNCFNLLFDGAAFCPHCGAARARAATGEATSTKCPGCGRPMRPVAVGSIDLLECTDCDGTWIEAATFERLCAERDSQSALLQRPARPIAATPPAVPIRYRPCPACGKLMNRVNFGHVSGTIIDVCRGHGAFLDRGELHRVVDFILHGGLEQTREIDRETRADEERRLREAAAEPAATSGWSENRGVEGLLAAILDRRG